MANVIKIPKKPRKGNTAAKIEVQKLRIAAYCRVSTDSDEQATSYETQISHYEEYIRSNPEWELVKVYADEGISATSTVNRDEFNQMIKDCRQGMIDMIITKSISRFARNTVDCLNYIRNLKQMNIPVYFEKESINTMDAKGEVLLTIMASLAQQESESLSQNVKLGMQYRFQQGKVMVNTKCFLGYDKDEDGKLVINPEEAEIVKRIFREYLEGASCGKICKGLERDGIKNGRGNVRWHDSTLRKMLLNEKYMGDALLQKTYTIDFLTRKRIKNTGELPQYYVEDDHEPIISKEFFLQVQEEMARRGLKKDAKGQRKGYSSKHCFTGITYCAGCNGYYKITRWNIHGKKKDVWRCSTRINNYTECSARTVDNQELQNAFIKALNKMIEDSSEYIQILTATLDTRGLYHADNTDDENVDYCSKLLYKGDVDAIAMVVPLEGDTNEKKIGELYRDVLKNFNKQIPVFMIHNKLDLFVASLQKQDFDDPLSVDAFNEKEFTERELCECIADRMMELNEDLK